MAIKNKHLLYWVLQITCWSVYALLNISFLVIEDRITLNSVIAHVLWAFFFLISTHIFRYFIIRFGWLKMPLVKLIPRLIVVILILSAANQAWQMLSNYALGILSSRDLQAFYILLNLFAINLPYLVWTLVYFMYHYIESYNESLKFEAAFHEMQLRHLKSQLNPHFIFNALNSIRALVDEDPVKSKTAITQLSNLLRNSLVGDRKRLTRINDEIQTVRDYLELETIRFEERLRTKIELHPDTNQFEIPPMMLQTLVENGIKHGISTLKEGGLIEIKTDVKDHYLTVQIRNSGRYVNGKKKNGSGFGLANTIKRLDLIYGKQATFDIKNEGGYVVTKIRIPQTV